MLSEKDMEDSSHFFLVTLTILLTAQIFDLSNKPPEIRADDRRGGRRPPPHERGFKHIGNRVGSDRQYAIARRRNKGNLNRQTDTLPALQSE